MRKRTVELLSCRLTDEEVLEKGKHLAEKELELIDLEAEAKEVASSYKENIKGTRTMIAKLSEEVSTEKEEREVSCDWVFHSPTRGTKELIRLDTGESIRQTEMTERDKQDAYNARQMSIV